MSEIVRETNNSAGIEGVEYLGEGMGATKFFDWRSDRIHERVDRGILGVDIHYFDTLRRFCDAAEARTVLEIGIGPEANSALTFASSMRNRLPAHIVSIDIDPTRPRPQDENAMRQFGVDWTIHTSDSLHANVTGAFDLLYIDGDHAYEYCLGEFERYEPMVKPGGYILVDDYPAFEGVCKAVTELETRGWHGLYVPYAAEDNGHVIYRKPGFMAPWVTDRNRGSYA